MARALDFTRIHALSTWPFTSTMPIPTAGRVAPEPRLTCQPSVR
jgi:hypothetical protein